MNAPDRIPTSLRHAPSAPLGDQELERLRAQAWVERGLICLKPEEIADEWVRAGVVQAATKRWGKRVKRR